MILTIKNYDLISQKIMIRSIMMILFFCIHHHHNRNLWNCQMDENFKFHCIYAIIIVIYCDMGCTGIWQNLAQVLFQFTTIKRETKLVDKDDKNPTIAPTLMKFQRGCHQVSPRYDNLVIINLVGIHIGAVENLNDRGDDEIGGCHCFLTEYF